MLPQVLWTLLEGNLKIIPRSYSERHRWGAQVELGSTWKSFSSRASYLVSCRFSNQMCGQFVHTWQRESECKCVFQLWKEEFSDGNLSALPETGDSSGDIDVFIFWAQNFGWILWKCRPHNRKKVSEATITKRLIFFHKDLEEFSSK